MRVNRFSFSLLRFPLRLVCIFLMSFTLIIPYLSVFKFLFVCFIWLTDRFCLFFFFIFYFFFLLVHTYAENVNVLERSNMNCRFRHDKIARNGISKLENWVNTPQTYAHTHFKTKQKLFAILYILYVGIFFLGGGCGILDPHWRN